MPLSTPTGPTSDPTAWPDCADRTPVPTNPVDWHPHYTHCLRYFLDKGQRSPLVQSVCAYLNIRLPCQRLPDLVDLFVEHPPGSSTPPAHAAASSVSLRSFVRRLVVTAEDTPAMLEAFFGDHWLTGVGPIRDEERLNYLFTAKSSGWAATKAAYDILPDEHVPFIRPLRAPSEEEIRTAEARWSEWLAMEDWMVGPRSPWRVEGGKDDDMTFDDLMTH